MSAVARLPATLATPRLVLSRFLAADHDALVAGLDDLAVSRWLARVPHPYRGPDADAYLAVQATPPDYAIRRAEDGRLVGGIGLVPDDAKWELGYWLAQPYWGRGFATEAGRALVTAAAAIPGRPPLVSGHFLGNEPSAGVLAKLGFVAVGRSRRRCVALGRHLAHVDMVYGPDRAVP